MSRREFAMFAGALFLLASGNFFGGLDRFGAPSDQLPACAAAGLLLFCAIMRGRIVLSREAAGIAVLAAFAATGLPASADESSRWLVALACYAGGASLFDSRRADLARLAIGAGALLVVAMALHQRFVLFPELIPRTGGAFRSRLESFRIFSVFTFPAQFSAFVAMALPLALAARTARVHFRRGYEALIVLLAVSFFLAGSYSGLAAAAAGLCMARGTSFRSAAIVVVISAGAIAAISLGRTDGLAPFDLRLHTWHATIAGIADAPLLGHGPGSFASLYPEVYIKPSADEVLHPHNWPLLIAFESGIAGLVAFVLVIGSALRRPINDRSFRAAAVVFLAASLLDLADLSWTLRGLGFFALGFSSIHSPPAT